MQIRKVAAVLGTVSLFAALLTTPAFAKEGDKQLDFSLDVAGEPANELDTTVGFTFGGGYEFMNEWQVRGDISYYNWDEDVPFFGDVEYTRIPVAVSVRKYFALPPQGLTIFGQAGLELSFDDIEVGPFSDDEVNLGLPIGAGVDYSLTREFSVNAMFKHHFVEDSYTTLNFGVSYHF